MTNFREFSVNIADNGKTPHQLIKEYVASKLETDILDEAFDLAIECGREKGVAQYDKCILLILETAQISQIEALAHLRDHGIKV
jgi:hypothetical protein